MGVVWTFFLSSIVSLFLSPSLWETARYRLKYCLKGPLNPKQPTNQPQIPIYSMRYYVMCKVYTGYYGTSEIEHSLCACTVDNPLAKARGLSLRTGAQTRLYPSLNVQLLLISLILNSLPYEFGSFNVKLSATVRFIAKIWQYKVNIFFLQNINSDNITSVV